LKGTLLPAALVCAALPAAAGAEALPVATGAEALLGATAVNAPAPLATPVPYTGTELVHPSVFHRDGGWNGFPYWMAVTPYAHSDAQFENPSLYCSLDGRDWKPAPGVADPLVAKPPQARRYNSDPHLVADPDGRLHLFYRVAGGDGDDVLYLTSSRDGREWTPPRVVLDAPLADERQLSPAVCFDGRSWNLYYVDSSSYPYVIRRRTAARPEGPWSEPQAVRGIDPPEHKMLWHLDAFRWRGATVLLVDVTEIYRTQEGGQLFFAVSADGLGFTRAPRPVLAPGPGWDRSLYRSCCVPVGDGLEIWYSAWGPEAGWRLGHAEVRLPGPP
jgi:hypothetical protein